MPIAKCQVSTNAPRIVVEENKRKLTLLNDSRNTFVRTQVDGCAIVTGQRCDWIVSKPRVADLLIELKGRDVDHAVEQIFATAEYWRNNSHCAGAMAAVVICKQYPRIDTKIQRYSQRLARDFKAPLHVVSGVCECTFERLLKFA